jgi:hypothetical protein
MDTIIIRISGGLGNQLFSYAAARRLALVNKMELVIDDVSGFAYDSVYRRHYQLDHFKVTSRKASPKERLEPMSRVRRYFKRRWNLTKPYKHRRYIAQESNEFDPRLLSFKPKGQVFIEGNWQSEDYFKDIEPIIREDFQIVSPNDATNLKIAEQIRNCKAVAVHVRFFDEPDNVNLNNVPSDYYNRSIKAMEKIEPDAHYFIFSDRPLLARPRIPLPNHRITLVSHNHDDSLAYADLWLMTQCMHFIIANSTFSWWGAWLASNPAKQVIAPGLEMSNGKMCWGFRGLLPNEWIKI